MGSGGSVTTGGSGIPRLQELSYLEVTAGAVLDRVPFEGIRRRLVEHMIAVSEASPGTGNVASLRNAKANPKRYARNVSEALKELMRLGLVEKAVLPASAATAHLYKSTEFALTPGGTEWAELCRTDRRAAYDSLLRMLFRFHPQFGGYLEIVGRGIAIPLARWGEQPEPRGRLRYVRYLAARAAAATAEWPCGWQASEDEIESTIASYVAAIESRAVGRETEAFPRNQDFVGSCEEAIVKLAFTKAGTPIDYISHEILRRWTRFLGLANFSYYVPDPPTGLRLWPTADIGIDDDHIHADRRIGPTWRDRILNRLPEAYEQVRHDDLARSLWVPIYRVRAAVCFRLQVQDEEFDRALIELGRGERGQDLPYRINLDPAQYGNVPPSERPLIVTTRDERRTYYSISLVPNRTSPSTNAHERTRP
jgi:hypothetical protein